MHESLDFPHRFATILAAMVLAVAVLLFGSCAAPPPPPPTEEPAPPPTGVRVYDPAKAWNGYTLRVEDRRTPALTDMNGRVVHAWPEAQARSRVRLERDGSLLGISRGGALVRYAWDGPLLWEHRFEDGFAHHDVIRLANGNVMTLLRLGKSPYDTVAEISEQDGIVWTWRIEEHLDLAQAALEHPDDVTHANSVQELPPNPHGADARFRPGNLLISVRHLNRILIIDRQSGEVVWSFGDRLDFQHEALMIPEGQPGAGNIVVLSNGFRGTYETRQSAILEIDPTRNEIVRNLRPRGFYTRTRGLAQPLANGNLLIVSNSGRIFEITREDELVWEWAGPYRPSRPARYAPDHCPQLAALPRPKPVAIPAPEGYLHVDHSAYRFAYRGDRELRKIGGEKRQILKRTALCRPVMVPSAASLELVYGVRRKNQEQAIRFAVSWRDLETENAAAEEIWSDVIEPDGKPLREASTALASLEHHRVELCVEARAGEEIASPEVAWWQNPRIVGGDQPEIVEEDEADLSAEEREARRQQLEALGYVD